MATNFWIVDTFCDKPFYGTPASVFFVDDLDNDETLQNVAMEINTPETIFLKDLGNGSFESQCYTPNTRGLFFGNGLFAAAKVIHSRNPELREFNIICGIRIFLVNIDDNSKITVRFSRVELNRVSIPVNLSTALDSEIIVSIAECKDELIIEIRSPKRLQQLTPNLDILSRMGYKSFIITSDKHYETDSDFDYCAQVFAPNLSIYRDITTPIAHAKLATYWDERLGKSEMIGTHNSPNKIGIVEVRCESEFTYITGHCAISTEGEMFCF